LAPWNPRNALAQNPRSAASKYLVYVKGKLLRTRKPQTDLIAINFQCWAGTPEYHFYKITENNMKS